MCNKTNMHHSMLINAVNHTYPNYYSHLADVLFCLTGIFTYQTDALPSRRDASPPPGAPTTVPGAPNGSDAAAAHPRHGCECCDHRDASAAPAGPPATRPGLPQRRRGGRGSRAAALQRGQPTPEEDHAASASDGADVYSCSSPACTLRRQTVPWFLITGVRQALVAALDAIRAAHEGRDEAARVRAWKLFLLLPRLLLARSDPLGRVACPLRGGARTSTPPSPS